MRFVGPMRPRLSRVQRTWRRLMVGACVCLAFVVALAIGAAGSVSAKEPPGARASAKGLIKDPHYGDGLFYFYQSRYFTSVTGLMVSQHFDRVPLHKDEAEVLRGGLFLSYGLHREAGQIFAELIERGAPPAVRDRAWYYLAKIRYQRGFIGEAEDAIARIESPLPPPLEEDRLLLHSNLLMARADFTAAAKVLSSVPAKGSAGTYARYNLGVALMRSGDVKSGSVLLDDIGKAPATTEEFRSLRDKANLALGFTALQGDRPADARLYLERVRLAGLHSNKALLGFGWAASALKQPQSALVPWTELADRNPPDAAVLEAKLAVPYAFAELGAYGQALDRYKEAISLFDRENVNLDESINAIRGGKLLAGLLERNPGEEMGWFWNIEELPEMPHSGHLHQVLAQHEFQEAFKNWRDLQFLTENLKRWQDGLAVLEDMLANRRLAFGNRLPVVKEQERNIDIDAMQRRYNEIAADMARAMQEADGVAFATPKERDLIERIENSRVTIEAETAKPGGAGDASMARARERLRHAAGALTWHLANEYPVRVWEARKDLKIIEDGLVEARHGDGALAAAKRDEPAHFEQFAQRIVELGKRLQALSPRVTQLAAEQQTHVQELAVTELTRQKDRLAQYTTQARFAVAQIYDRANTAQESRRGQ